jgi:S1-C subfamily serine protease
MIEPITVTEEMMYCTARIVEMNASNASIKFGTGFFYAIPHPEATTQNIPLLVTNKHVVDGASSIEFVMHTAKRLGLAPKCEGRPVRHSHTAAR